MIELTAKQKWALEKFDELAAANAYNGVPSANKAGLICGVTGGVVSQLRSGIYKGDSEKQFNRLISYFENKEAAAESYTGVDYVPTSTSQLVYKTLRNVQLKGGFVIVTGDAGIGKTKAIHKYIEDNPLDSITIRINPCYKSTNGVLKLIAMELGLSTRQARDDLWMSIVTKLRDGMIIAVDEAQHLTYAGIETLRSFTDYFDEKGQTMGVALIGNEGIREKMDGRSREQYRQVNNRAWQRHRLSTTDTTLEDIKMLFPLLEGREQELKLLHKVAQTPVGIRGAVKLFSNAYQAKEYDWNGLINMAKVMQLNLNNTDKAVRR